MRTLSQRNGRHVSSARAGGALQNPAYRPADVFENEGFGATTPDPSPFQESSFRDGAKDQTSDVQSGSQLILGTVGLHGVKYDGHVIKTDKKNKLLKSVLFEEVSESLKPYYAKLLQ